MLRASSTIAGKTGMGLAPGLARLDVSDWRNCTLVPRVDALYVSTIARYLAAGEEAWRKVPRSPLPAIARERILQAMKWFCTFSWKRASCRAAADIVSSTTGTSTSSVKISNRPGSLAKQKQFCFQAGNMVFVLSNKEASLIGLTWFSPIFL